MPNLDVCTGAAFTTGSLGELDLAGVGTAAWPFSGAIGTYNGLTLDATKGVWTAPHGCYSQYQKFSNTGINTPLDSTHTSTILPVGNFTFTNPSAIQQGRLLCFTQLKMDFTLAAQTLIQMTGMGNILGQTMPLPTAPTVPVGNPTTSTQSVSQTVQGNSEILLAGGATATYGRFGQATFLGGGAGSLLVNWTFDVLFLLILLDPTQAGGVS
jgi:hypothetical protein